MRHGAVTAIEFGAAGNYRCAMTKGEDYQKRALAADSHAEASLGITRAHFVESAKAWREKALEAGYVPVVEKARRSRKTAAVG